MTTVREFTFNDLFKYNRIVFDPLAEVYSLSFLATNLLKFPNMAHVAVAPDGQLMGYIIGRREKNEQSDWFGDGSKDLGLTHICALAVAHEYRRLGLGTMLMRRFVAAEELRHDWYVDLYVRAHNKPAIKLYEALGYVKYRFLKDFYPDDNGYEMRLSLAKDRQQSLGSSLLIGLEVVIDSAVLWLFSFKDWLTKILLT